MAIKTYSTTPASNTALFPENMNPSAVNDGMRQVQADMRADYQDSEWRDWGDSGVSRASATTFKVTGDATSRYLVNRAIRVNDAATYYGVVVASSYSAPDTTVTVDLDSGSLTASLTAVAIAALTPLNRSIPTALGRKGVDVASASTINLSTSGGTICDVTGTTTITAITSEPKGTTRKVRFTGALTLTHNSTSLQLPGSANITTVAGDTAEFFSLDGTNWKCFNYVKVTGEPIAAYTDTNPFVKGSGDATKQVRIEADGITTATTRVWTAPDCDIPRFFIQEVHSETGAVATGTTILPLDDTIPQNNEGDQYMSISITPKSTANILCIEVQAVFNCTTGSFVISGALFQDSTANALAAIGVNLSTTRVILTLRHWMVAGTTSATTFKFRAGVNSSATVTLNGNGGTREFGGVSNSSIAVREYSA